MKACESNPMVLYCASDYKRVFGALSAAAAASSRPTPFHEFRPYSPVKVLQVDGKKLTLGEAPLVAVARRDEYARTL